MLYINHKSVSKTAQFERIHLGRRRFQQDAFEASDFKNLLFTEFDQSDLKRKPPNAQPSSLLIKIIKIKNVIVTERKRNVKGTKLIDSFLFQNTENAIKIRFKYYRN